ncbi:adenosylhomocysteinase [Desulfosporosinus orientis DSM 765]|uniref:Adenosylhomocysteinase n=1 Tax=Desulfosporosinus orientis (strain ATCC 19365 / DSM 765 / NCIMB 8382 / VKM B-1628 / Singapore I) TaxID=768706 RepID=G7W5X5_DESOD|nr:adenosylhomocysteinase [Desulfosporosinus orientis]AET67351.1 adenosylhomocysteinase [Desulfosporosinus orientis DSM 765]
MDLKYTIRDLSLAGEGQRKIDWVKPRMQVLNSVRKQFEEQQPFKGKKVVICLHLEAKTAYLAQVIKAGGADVTVVASNPLSTQDDVVAALVQSGIGAHAWYNATDEEYNTHLQLALDTEPDFIIDDGGDLVSTLHTTRPELLQKVKGGAEETTTGVLRLHSMARDGVLKFPMIAVNDAQCKYLFDNRYGTGQSVWDGIMRTTNLVVAGKTAVIAGYGWCGKGVALRAKGLGARVIVCEVNPIKANEALMDGFEVMPMVEAAKHGDFFITVTGNTNIINKEHFVVMKPGAVMCNAGHFDVEVNVAQLKEIAVSERVARANIMEYVLADGRQLYVLAEGRLVNLAAGDGHPAEVMDMTFALQALSLEYVALNYETLSPEVYQVTTEIDERVAMIKLQSLGLSIDKLTKEQEAYLASWSTEE